MDLHHLARGGSNIRRACFEDSLILILILKKHRCHLDCQRALHQHTSRSRRQLKRDAFALYTHKQHYWSTKKLNQALLLFLGLIAAVKGWERKDTLCFAFLATIE
jgi:hypothetical protein